MLFCFIPSPCPQTFYLLFHLRFPIHQWITPPSSNSLSNFSHFIFFGDAIPSDEATPSETFVVLAVAARAGILLESLFYYLNRALAEYIRRQKYLKRWSLIEASTLGGNAARGGRLSELTEDWLFGPGDRVEHCIANVQLCSMWFHLR